MKARASLRGQVARLTAEVAETKEELARAMASAESYRRAATERTMALELSHARALEAARLGELDALRKLSEALSAGALHSDHCIEQLTDAIRDALATRTTGRESDSEVH